MKISNKFISIYLAVFAVLYFVYTVYLIGHGIHWSNSMITVAVIALAVYYYLKKENEK